MMWEIIVGLCLEGTPGGACRRYQVIYTQEYYTDVRVCGYAVTERANALIKRPGWRWTLNYMTCRLRRDLA